MNTRVYTIATLCSLSAISACDPCASTFSCEQAPRVAVVGQILDKQTGRAVSGVRIEMQRESGVALLGSVVGTSTDEHGDFVIEMRAAEVGDAVISLTVSTPGDPSYRILGLRTRATVVTGDALILKPVVSANPVIPWVIELYQNGTSEPRIANAAVEFRRTGGVRMYRSGVEVDVAVGTTDGVGWVFPFRELTTDAAGDLIGDVIVRPPPPLDSAVFTGVTVTAVPWYAPSNGLYRLGVGPT